MLFTYFIAMLVILGLLAGWIGVQHLARRFAERHPEFGPAREEGGSCLFCLCGNGGHCAKRDLQAKVRASSSSPSPSSSSSQE